MRYTVYNHGPVAPVPPTSVPGPKEKAKKPNEDAAKVAEESKQSSAKMLINDDVKPK